MCTDLQIGKKIKDIFEKAHLGGEDAKTYDKVSVIMMIWCLHREGNIDQLNSMENSEADS